jgi:Fic family protein
MEVLFNQPYTKVAFLVEKKIVARQQAAVYLKKLENIGFLESKKAGREMLYLNKGLLNILSES